VVNVLLTSICNKTPNFRSSKVPEETTVFYSDHGLSNDNIQNGISFLITVHKDQKMKMFHIPTNILRSLLNVKQYIDKHI